MDGDTPEPLWREVVGDTEPWRRGRILLGSVAALTALGQALVIFAAFTAGSINFALATVATAIVWWLLFAFIWFGTHWLRWLLGGIALLFAFAQWIWAVRDGAWFLYIGVVTNTFLGVTCFAPSVHFFAVRQRERIRWPEKLIVAGVFIVLFASAALASVAFNLYTAAVRQEAVAFEETALRRIFAQHDTAFLLAHASDPFARKYGPEGLSGLLARSYMRVGELRNLQLHGPFERNLQVHYAFPARIDYSGVLNASAMGDCGPVQLRVIVLRAADGWRIDGFWWQCMNG